MVSYLEPRGGREAQDDSRRVGQRAVRDAGSARRLGARGALPREQQLTQPPVRLAAGDALDGEAVPSLAQARGRHALDGEHRERLKAGGLPDQDEVEVEGLAGGDLLALAPGLDDVRARRGRQAAQERRRPAVDEGLEEPRVDALAPQPAGPAVLPWAHDADQAPQRVSEGAAQHRTGGRS